jgi:hypothetical protein
MHNRCYSPRNRDWARYGGRGITVCAAWNSVEQFLVDMGHPPATGGLSIDRIDNDGNYEPGNCRWATQEESNDNTCRNKFVEWQGKSQTIKEWAKELDMEPRRISERLNRGWTVERTLTTKSPKGYEQGRGDAVERAKKLWAVNGRRYRGLGPVAKTAKKTK